jgi:hypothetical protein
MEHHPLDQRSVRLPGAAGGIRVYTRGRPAIGTGKTGRQLMPDASPPWGAHCGLELRRDEPLGSQWRGPSALPLELARA